MKIMAIIPARGGSKGIYLKNIKKLNKIPLVNYTIKNSIKSKIFDHIIVSTDSKKIFNTAKKHKNIMVFNRSRNIAKDTSRLEETMSDVLRKIYILKQYQPDWIFVLQPTSPLRSPNTLIKAKNILKKNSKINSLIALLLVNGDPGKLINRRFVPFEKHGKYRRQDRQSAFIEAGALYCVKYRYFKKTKKLKEKKPFGFQIPKIENVDIDDLQDFRIAEALTESKL